MSAIAVVLLLIGQTIEPKVEATSHYTESEIATYNEVLSAHKLILDQHNLYMSGVVIFAFGLGTMLTSALPISFGLLLWTLLPELAMAGFMMFGIGLGFFIPGVAVLAKS